jgi:hypothetical protein
MWQACDCVDRCVYLVFIYSFPSFIVFVCFICFLAFVLCYFIAFSLSCASSVFISVSCLEHDVS